MLLGLKLQYLISFRQSFIQVIEALFDTHTYTPLYKVNAEKTNHINEQR